MKRILPIIGLIAVLLIVGTVGFGMITGKGPIECLYLSVITLMTVGYREPEPIQEGGMIFVIVYLLSGAGTFMYLITSIGRWIVSDQVRHALEQRRMQQTINNMSEHLIVCGCGQMGEIICRQLVNQNRQFVVIENSLDRIQELCIPESWAYLHGDATDDGMLQRAGLARAGGLAAVLSSDADNLYVVLSANMDNQPLAIVARAAEESAARKLRQAGARHVINPYQAGAVRMARLMLHSGLENLMEIVDGHHADLELAELPVTEDGPLAGREISQSPLPERGLTVIAIRHPDGSRQMPVSGNDRMTTGDSILVVGQQTAIQQFLAEASSTNP
ncbi:MAG: NAD-binding protein [Planctomycetota bacterium]|nr:NAD-binding protein [Planctomycetota bacterium]